MCGCDLILFHCDMVQLLEKSFFYSRSLPGLIRKWYNFSQKPVEHFTGTEIIPSQCDLLFQDIDILKSNWNYFEVNVWL